MTSMETPPHLEEARRIVASWPEWKRNMGHRLDPAPTSAKRPAQMPNPVKGLRLSLFPMIKEH